MFACSILTVYMLQSVWLYPVLAELNWIGRGLFMLFASIFLIGLYFVGEVCHGLVTIAKGTPTKRVNQTRKQK